MHDFNLSAPMSSADHLEFLRELFGFVPGLALRRMFGGVGVYQDDLIFALSIEEQIYLKTDAETVAAFQARGLKPFSYEAKGKTQSIAYYELDAEAFEDSAVLRHWVQLALAAAVRRRAVTKPKAKPAGKTSAKAKKPSARAKAKS